jgi:hypothetical protein
MKDLQASEDELLKWLGGLQQVTKEKIWWLRVAATATLFYKQARSREDAHMLKGLKGLVYLNQPGPIPALAPAPAPAPAPIPPARPKRGRPPRRDPDAGLWDTKLSFEDNIEKCLSFLMGLVTDSDPDFSSFEESFSLSPFLPCSTVAPPNISFSKSLCLCIDKTKAAAAKRSNCYQFCEGSEGDGYLDLVLCGHRVRAHRFVLWAYHGFRQPSAQDRRNLSSIGSPELLHEPLCLHICGNKSCINPFHLVWGGHKDNLAPDRCKAVYSKLLIAQSRQVDSEFMYWLCKCRVCVPL